MGASVITYHNMRKLVLGLAKEYSVSYRDDTSDGNATSSVQKQGNRIHMDAEQRALDLVSSKGVMSWR
jgi:hypothetical protein